MHNKFNAWKYYKILQMDLSSLSPKIIKHYLLLASNIFMKKLRKDLRKVIKCIDNKYELLLIQHNMLSKVNYHMNN